MNTQEKFSEDQNKKIVSYLAEQDLRKKYASKLAQQHAVYREKKQSIFALTNWLKYAAVSVLFISVVFVTYHYVESSSPKQMALQQIKDTKILGDPSAMRKDVLFIEQLRTDANYAFIHHNYDEAVRNFENIISTGNQNPNDYFYLGVSYLKSSNPKPTLALDAFEKIKDDKSLIQEIRWFTALALILQKDEKEAKIILEQIVQNKGYKFREAQKLLKAM